jgi:hypothetical protein
MQAPKAHTITRKGSVAMPLDKSSNESIKQSICDYIAKADIFYSTHPTTANKWCLGICAESPNIAEQMETYLPHIIKNQTVKTYSNKSALQWCNGKYNVVIVTQYTKEDIAALKAALLCK